MKTINLRSSGNYEKYSAIKQLGYDVRNEGNYLVLVDNKHSIDKYIDPYFRNVNEILNVLTEPLLRVGYKIIA